MRTRQSKLLKEVMCDVYATIPTNIVSGEFAQAAFDNADYGQENAS